MKKVVALLESQPVRMYLYTLLGAVVAALAVLGVVSGAVVPVVMAVVTAALSVPTVEKVHGAVSPVVPDSPDPS